MEFLSFIFFCLLFLSCLIYFSLCDYFYGLCFFAFFFSFTVDSSTIGTLTTSAPTTTTTELPPECLKSTYGCCPDNYTASHGPNDEGCCLSSLFGCCPDHITEAQGPNLQGDGA